MSLQVPIAILASGRGSNFEAIERAVRTGQLDAEIRVVLTDRPGAPVVEKARKAGIAVVEVPARREVAREAHDTQVIEALRPFDVRFLVFAGYMRVVTSRLIDAFRSDRGDYSRIVNIHPSLLPAFPGKEGYAQAYHYGCGVTGVTVHLVDEHVDGGPVCAQRAFSIADCRSAEEVEARGLEVEHVFYPETLRWVLPEDFKVEERVQENRRRVCVRPS